MEEQTPLHILSRNRSVCACAKGGKESWGCDSTEKLIDKLSDRGRKVRYERGGDKDNKPASERQTERLKDSEVDGDSFLLVTAVGVGKHGGNAKAILSSYHLSF